MAAGRTLRSLLSRRRRAADEGEDEDGPVVVEDSQSEGSMASDMDGDGADVSSMGATSVTDAIAPTGAQSQAEPLTNGRKSGKKARKNRKKGGKKDEEGVTIAIDAAQPQTVFKTVPDTETMINRLPVVDGLQAHEVVDFESMQPNGMGLGISKSITVEPAATNGHHRPVPERQKSENEENKKKRDADLVSIPNRGPFFMHDTRGQPFGHGLPLTREVWQNKGRGRGNASVGGPFSPANQMAMADRATEQTWQHDLHETITEKPAPLNSSVTSLSAVPEFRGDSARHFQKSASQNVADPHVLSFSSTTVLGKMQSRVSLPGMKAPLVFSEVPWKHYVRLPDHRPPLRRDKPVRISLPGPFQRYIFPTSERSFIFIPRQMRPNQQGYHRGYQRSVGGHGYSSRRTSAYGGSVYGGSVYSPSIAASRRSSFTGIPRENAFSPVSSFAGMPSNRPVVRLPYGSQQFSATSTPVGPLSGQHTPTGLPQIHTYPLPQQPAFQGTPTTTVHQPRPQKAISVTGIESPAMLQQSTPQEAQPFQNQLPARLHEQQMHVQHQGPPPPFFAPRQPFSFQGASQNGTPLSGIPEQAIHAPSFQPPPAMQYGQPPFFNPYAAQQNMFYSPPGPNGFAQVPMFVPPQGYMMPPPSAPQQQPQQPQSQLEEDRQQPQQAQTPSRSRMVAHESNGMVFYIPASEAQSSENYQPAESFVPTYAMPPLAPPTPAPDASDIPVAYYYPPMQPSGMQEINTTMYYPNQQ